ncbi:hypothetical protein BO71DRAFT_396087 [Aspergillus ellipticus CBS 707.79]|uniref:LysM domain-containing protein n=1 Tax=Aspergillus ellipticus CBS 707.79 TaxID=1448320 RepID=A0A319E9X7_9EURO|nr:hypothetical protein BO71DRAFT_396087 [Aspergillus ellipticus CBS 707.79]
MLPTSFNISIADATTLNPWIGKDCDAGIWSALSSDGYEQLCVHKAQPPTTTTSTTTSSGGTRPPAPTQPRAIATCKKRHTVVQGDGCWAIANKYGITLDQFYSWNPGVGTSCSSLWLGYAVCVGI